MGSCLSSQENNSPILLLLNTCKLSYFIGCRCLNLTWFWKCLLTTFRHFFWALTISWWRILTHVWSGPEYTGHFTHEPRAMTMKLWEPKRMCPKAIPTHLQNHVVVWSRTLKCRVKSHVTGPSTKCYFNEFLFIRVLTHDKIKSINSCEHSKCHDLLVLC